MRAVLVDADRDDVPDRVGDTVTVSGIAATDSYETLPAPMIRAYLQDGTHGIRLQTHHMAVLRSVRRGDSLTVTGVLGADQGMPTLEPIDLRRFGSGSAPEASLVSIKQVWGAEMRGRLVKVRGRLENNAGVEIRDSTGVVPVLGRAALLDNPAFSAKYYGAQPATVVGVVEQYAAGYRIELIDAQGLILARDLRPAAAFLFAVLLLAASLVVALAWRGRRSGSVSPEWEREVEVEVATEARRDAISDLDLAEGLGALAGEAPVAVRDLRDSMAEQGREAVPVHVLAVDDEWAVRQLVARMGERVGLSVELAADGEEALTMFRAASDSFDLVLLDVNLPQLSGEEVFAAMREERPDIRVVFMSGYTAEDVLERTGNAAGVSMLEKPFTVGSFQRVIADAVPAGVVAPEAATPPGAASEP